MKVHTKQFGDKQLILTPSALFISNYSLPAKMSPGGFSALLKKYLDNQRILSLKIHGVDRIVIMEFPEVTLVLELFAKGNLILCNKEMTIIKSMRREEWKDRKLEQFEKYKFPTSRGTNPEEETLAEFEKKIKQNPKTFFGACVDVLNTSPLILEYAFDELKLDKTKDANKTLEKDVSKLFHKMKEIYSSKEGPVFVHQGVIYSTEIGKEKEKEFENIQAALNTLLISNSEKKEVIIKENPAKEEAKKKVKFEKDIEAKQNQIEGLGVKETESQKKGEEIFLHYQEIKEVLGAIDKAKAKGLTEKEIVEKINAIKPLIKELDFKKNIVKLNF
jgi:predicted ribosome quality control (RQC) complex YloA/Tae2 family protein